MNLETKITIYKFTPQLFTLTRNMAKAAATSKDMPMICYSLLKNCVEEWLRTILRNN